MPIVVEIVDEAATKKIFEEIFAYFKYIDEKFSVFKNSSEITAINNSQLRENDYSHDMKIILALAEETKKITNGYFDIIRPDGKRDPSGLVKGWAIYGASKILEGRGFQNFYVDAGGDIQARGTNSFNEPWRVGIQNPFARETQIVRAIQIENRGVATSGTYIRGQHIYNPKKPGEPITDIVSLTVVGPNVYEADRFATAAFAMGKDGILFIEKLGGFEGYLIDKNGLATQTSNFEKYIIK